MCSTTWVQQIRKLLSSHPLFVNLFEKELIPPPSSNGFISVLRGLPKQSSTIPGNLILVNAFKGLAQAVQLEAEELGSALTTHMIEERYSLYSSNVDSVFKFVQSAPSAFGFAFSLCSFAPPHSASRVFHCKSSCAVVQDDDQQ